MFHLLIPSLIIQEWIETLRIAGLKAKSQGFKLYQLSKAVNNSDVNRNKLYYGKTISTKCSGHAFIEQKLDYRHQIPFAGK